MRIAPNAQSEVPKVRPLDLAMESDGGGISATAGEKKIGHGISSIY